MKPRRLVAALLLPALLIGAAGLFLAPYATAKMDMTLMDVPAATTPARLYAYDPATRAHRGGELTPVPGGQLLPPSPRVYVPYGELPDHLINAFVAIEDRHFWRHGGVDTLRTARAAACYLTGQGGGFGGSTITQQLVKNLTGEDAPTVERKITEIFTALDLERQRDKTEILEAYLNVINLAEGCYGVGAAARRYFSAEVSDLTLPQCATLAAITNCPARYDPLLHPEACRARRDLILSVMAKEGYITPARRDEAMATELELDPTPPPPTPVTSWYADLVVSDVIRDLCERLGWSYARASAAVYGGGLTVVTAMDTRMQALVEDFYADPAHFPTGERGTPQSGFILIDPHTGDVLAVAGAVGEKTANRLQSHATDTRRPAGSCIKPLSVYAPALERGMITWATPLEDGPCATHGGKPWPANADGVYRGTLCVGEAVARSTNTVAVRLLGEVGTHAALRFLREELDMKNLCLPAEGEEGDATAASLALGQNRHGVTLRELTAAYTVFTDGEFKPPVSYHRVLDADGHILLENPPAPRPVLSVENAAIMTRLLTAVTADPRGTAHSLTLPAALGVEAAGKTGTTQGGCDRLFVGYTPRLLGGVWLGYDTPSPLGLRGNAAVGVWDGLMTACEEAYGGRAPCAAFPLPDGVVEVEFCPLSGGTAGEWCADPTGELAALGIPTAPTERGWFRRGTEPTAPCPLHAEPDIPYRPADPTRPHDVLPFAGGVTSAPPEVAPPPTPRRPWWRFWG